MGGCGINWTMCKSFAPHCRHTTMPASHHSIFYRSDALPDEQPCQSTEGKVVGWLILQEQLKPSGTCAVCYYRPLKQRSRMPAMTVMRQSDVSRNDEDDLLPFNPEKSVKQRLQVIRNLLLCGLKHCKWYYMMMILFFVSYSAPSPPVGIIWAMMIVWRIRGKIMRTVLCCALYDSCEQWYAHTYDQFLKMSVGFGLRLVLSSNQVQPVDAADHC